MTLEDDKKAIIMRMPQVLQVGRGIELSVVRMGKILEGMGLARDRARPRLTERALRVIRASAKQSPEEFCQRGQPVNLVRGPEEARITG
jgi:hypothetical protein